jgi:hypothetical protein
MVDTCGVIADSLSDKFYLYFLLISAASDAEKRLPPHVINFTCSVRIAAILFIST